MFYLNKTVKYSSINFNSNIKKVFIYNMHWIDSTYDVTITEKVSKLDGTLIHEDIKYIDFMSIDRLKAMYARYIK